MSAFFKILFAAIVLAVMFFAFILAENYFMFPLRYSLGNVPDLNKRFVIGASTTAKLEGYYYTPNHKIEYFVNKPRIQSSKTVVFFGGNNEDVVFMFDYLRETFPNLNILAINYPGYGLSLEERELLLETMAAKMMRILMREFPDWTSLKTFYENSSLPKETFENKIYRFVNEVWEKENITGDVYVIGRSLGSGVAAEEVYRHKNITKALLITPYNNMPSVACSAINILPIYACKNWMDNIFESEGKLSQSNVEVWVVYAKNDEVVPNVSTERLLKFIKNKKVFLLNDADHNNIVETNEFEAILKDFINN